MAGNFTDYWRIVKPTPQKTGYATAGGEAAKLYSNFSFFNKVIKGASSRFGKYTQYRNMDSDVFVARALDTVAEEMCQFNAKTSLPFEIIYQNESNTEIPENITMTVRAALRYWSEIQDFNTILFDICRNAIQYGDCVFRKDSDMRKWQFIDMNNIIGITLDDYGKPEWYHLRGSGDKNKTGAFGDVDLVPAAGIVHFSLSSSMNDGGPFGESVLFAAVKAYRHLSLLEDAVIIYRIVRAPERRAFFIDTGNMPPQRAKAYLESLKTEMRQKRIPNDHGGVENVDSVYNPLSMNEDFFFSQGADGRGSRVETLPGGECLALDTKIKLMDGRDISLEDLIVEYKNGKNNWVYSCDPISGEFKPGKITWAGVTRTNTRVLKITLDNGESLVVTPDHEFPIKGLGAVEAKDLLIGQSLISLKLKENDTKIFDNVDGNWVSVLDIVKETIANTMYENTLHYKKHNEKCIDVLHNDLDESNNSPDNLIFMGSKDKELLKEGIKNKDQTAIDTLGFNLIEYTLDSITGEMINSIDAAEYQAEIIRLFEDGYSAKPRLSKPLDVDHFDSIKVVDIEYLEDTIDTGTITVDGGEILHDYHTFALSSGVYTFNSLGEIADLTYFQNKFLQGLRIPSSYMRGGEEGGVAISDGKVGIAYIEEVRFSNYVARLQNKLNDCFDAHFKAYLKSSGLNINPQIFKLKLVDPQNFTKYKRAEIDEKMISNYNSIKDSAVLSERFKLYHYLGLTEDDIQENEAMLRQEKFIPEGGLAPGLDDLRMMYDPTWYDNIPEIKVDDKYNDFTKETASVDDESDEEGEEEAPGDEEEGGDVEPLGDPSVDPDTPEDDEEVEPDSEPAPEPVGDAPKPE